MRREGRGDHELGELDRSFDMCQGPGCPFQRERTGFGLAFCREGWTRSDNAIRQQIFLDQPGLQHRRLKAQNWLLNCSRMLLY